MRLQEFAEIASDRYEWTLNDARLAPQEALDHEGLDGTSPTP
jgi:hypothetical protein